MGGAGLSHSSRGSGDGLKGTARLKLRKNFYKRNGIFMKILTKIIGFTLATAAVCGAFGCGKKENVV